jgi:hypothetical protein
MIEHEGLCNSGESPSMGQVVAEFKDFRARITIVFGLVLMVLVTIDPIARVAQGKRPDTGVVALLFGGLLLGLLFVAVGSFFHKRRILVYDQGVGQIKGLKKDSILWHDIQQIHCETETRYGSGLAYRVRHKCWLQRPDGTWLALNAIPITPQVMKGLRKFPAFANVGKTR